MGCTKDSYWLRSMEGDLYVPRGKINGIHRKDEC